MAFFYYKQSFSASPTTLIQYLLLFASITTTSCMRRSMLCFGNRLLSRASGQTIAARTTISLLLQSGELHTSFGMTSRKRPLPDSFVSNASRKMTSSNDDTDTVSRQSKSNDGQQQKRYRPLVIVLAGPTAVGKSDVAAEVCSSALATDISRGHYSSFLSQQSKNNNNVNDIETANAATRGHVVSADSVQAYRGVDIGANKPTVEEMERTPHHLVDVVDPPTDPSKAASYNAADWMRDATYVIQTLTSHHHDSEGDSSGNEFDIGESDVDDETLLRMESIDKALSQSLGLPQFSKTVGATQTDQPTVLPVVVGGTMMYLQWLVHGRPDAIRPSDEAVERAANTISKFQSDAQALYENVKEEHKIEEDETTSEEDAVGFAAWKVASTYVSSLGPVFSQRVEKLPGRDWYRLRRLLEVAYTIASKKMVTNKDNGNGGEAIKSEEEILQQMTEKEVYTGIRSGSLPDLGYDVRSFFLCPTDRMTHFHTVDSRCEQMLLRGLPRETATLYAAGGLPDGSQAARAIGYRQALEYLKRKDAKSNDTSALNSFVEGFATATRQYAKKQMQWFRRDADFAFIPVDMECDKAKRVASAAQTVAELCKLPREDFEKELSSEMKDADGSDEKDLPLSAQTKLENERQGKKMKFFMSKRVRLVEGSDDFLAVLAEADECTRKVQGLAEEF